MRGMSGLSWLLPVSSIGFFAFVGTAVYGAVTQDWSAWLLAAIALPGIPFVWLGLMIALLDVTRRPDEHVSDEARMIWTGVICILNVIAFPIYWLAVVRTSPPLPDAPRRPTTSASATEEEMSDPSQHESITQE
jgi:hypothetical protein